MCNIECQLWNLARKKAAGMNLSLPQFCPRAQSGECPANGPACQLIDDDPYQPTVAGAAQDFQVKRVEGQARISNFKRRTNQQS